MNFKKGLFRVWIVGTILWYSYALISHTSDIGYFAGYWYAVLNSNSSFSSALDERKRTEILIESCVAARRTVCEYVQTDSYLGEWNCPDMQMLLEEQKKQALARGLVEAIKATNPEACEVFYDLHLPRLRWLLILELLLMPFVPVVVYLVGRWVARGFRTA